MFQGRFTRAVGVDLIQMNFEPLQRQVELWRKTQVTDESKADLLQCVHLPQFKATAKLGGFLTKLPT